MRFSLRALLALTVATLATAAPAGAILNGKPDTEHTYVGIFVTVVDGQRVPVCSGFLVSPTVFVTAAHCVHALGGELPAFVSFEQAYTAESELVSGTAVPNPDFDPAATANDIALVLLDEEVSDRGFAELPRLGLLDSLAKRKGLQDRSLTIVGYGSFVRSWANSRLINLRSANAGGFDLQISSNPGQGKGAICFGDSGGPVLLGSSDVAVGINSYVNNRHCAGNAFAFRLDTAQAQGFLAPYL